jgi:hypothetical protein
MQGVKADDAHSRSVARSDIRTNINRMSNGSLLWYHLASSVESGSCGNESIALSLPVLWMQNEKRAFNRVFRRSFLWQAECSLRVIASSSKERSFRF